MVLGILSFSFYKTVLTAKTVDVLPTHDGRYDAVSSVFYSLYSIRLINVEMKQAVEVSKNIKSSSVALYDKDSLYVVYVIGESYVKNHAQLYGYYLPTTPNLCKEKAKGNLFVFDNVVTPYNQTTLVMKNTFCCNSLADGEKYLRKQVLMCIFGMLREMMILKRKELIIFLCIHFITTNTLWIMFINRLVKNFLSMIMI